MDLKKRVQELCKSKNITSQQLELDLGFGKGYVSKLNSSVPNVSKIQQIADYLSVPLDFLLGRPPFDHWELINQNRQNFLKYVDEESDILDLVWGIDLKNPDAAPAKDFISMLALCIESASPNEDGSWAIAMKPSHKSKEKTPALTEKDKRDVAREVDKIMEDLAESGDLMFDGVPMSDEARAAMAAAMRVGLEEARRRNKVTYTPKNIGKGNCHVYQDHC